MLGIDVSKDSLACALYDRHRERFCWLKSLPHTPQGLSRLLDQTPADMPWVLEPGALWAWAL